MSLEDVVRTSIEELAREIQPTLPDPAAIRSGVNRGRRIRAVATVGLAAAVTAAVVVGANELREDTGSTPPVIGLDDVGTPVWMVDGVLHIGDQEFVQHKLIDTALVPVEGGAVYGARDGEIIYQPVGGPAQVIESGGEALPPSAPKPGPAADPDSGLVAVLRWSVDATRYDLTMYDLARGRELSGGGFPVGDDFWGVPGDPNPFGDTPVAPIEWMGATDGGYTVFIRNGTDLWQHDSDSGLAPVGQLPLDVTLGVFAHSADGRLTFTTPEGTPLSNVTGVGADGGLSHDGAYYAGSSTDAEAPGAIAIVDTHTGQIRYLDAPDGSTRPTKLSWAAGHTLMFLALDADGSSGSVIACDTDTLQCVDAGDVDDVAAVTLPRL